MEKLVYVCLKKLPWLGSNAIVEKIFQYKRRGYRNTCLRPELIMSLSRLKLAHNTIENLMVININYGHPLREEIVVKVAQKYETTKTRVWTFNKPPEKHLVIENEDDDGSDSDDEVVEDLSPRMMRWILTNHYLFHDRGRYHIETSPLIYSANQCTGFYVITASVMKELSDKEI